MKAAKGLCTLMLCGALAALTQTAGCTLGPDYRRPVLELPAPPELTPEGANGVVNPRWWEGFGDKQLVELVETALRENRDLRTAAASVEEYLALYGVARADFYPQLSASASASRGKAAQSGSPLYPANPWGSQYQVSLNLSYELDLWGRVRRGTEAARADLLAREENRRGVALTLASQVATSYLQLLDLDRRLRIAKDTLDSRREARRLAEIRFKGGLTSDLDVLQSEVELTAAEALIPQLEQQVQLTEHRVSALTGHNPGRVTRGAGFDELKEPPLPAVLPSELLRRRPDVLQAEQALVAANARIGQTIASQFPQFSLTGMLGESTVQFLTFNWPVTVLNAGLSASVPIFTGFKDSNLVGAARARESQARLNYEQTAITAFREVYDALVSRRKLAEQVAVQLRQVAALTKTLKIARLRYLNGYSSYLEVLDAQRNLLNAELSLVQTRSSGLQTTVELYRALGGGWDTAQMAYGAKQ